MIKQIFDVDGYWEVVIYWNLDYHFFDDIKTELSMIGFSDTTIMEMKEEFLSGRAKAVTCSSIEEHISVVIFATHSSNADYINSIVHEAEHIKQSMLKAYRVEDSGEPPAYTIGYLVSQMYKVFKHLIQDCDCT